VAFFCPSFCCQVLQVDPAGLLFALSHRLQVAAWKLAGERFNDHFCRVWIDRIFSPVMNLNTLTRLRRFLEIQSWA
jgi:hypothetical protein